MSTNEKKTLTVALTGASGAVYGVRIVQELLKSGHTVHFLLTGAAWQVLYYELGMDTSDRERCLYELFGSHERLFYHTDQEFSAPIASGSAQNDGMVIVPCSMGTLAKIAHGTSSNLLERAADVALKERRKLIIVPRETPLNSIHLENMKRLSDTGAQIVPAMPGFYHQPSNYDDLVNFVVGKVLDQLGASHNLFRRWGES
ncbi:UbiX family flavin prenyltransferase [Salisediminibacterium halotolerans]|uniref:UbiX family flavin prenyltransferase n=1 Tax=Salisediminibacterium halotolerans TaxID=517425 RepID=UPI000EADA520|nr:flavin prenyltransferase UbiX [Salisediminibacterium halotolerans]RLJ77946.1 4-hydroxy-3-polyprenylbenzoate decarboxylase [Actinophytocola xinjiangensis]RPE88716.1 4-hydroxy-3-polyprenylbenzoate decarboxylase [Salisediminibacterium halotolerans]TWG36923.1 4-hydroxy-3-polyprenylbenzoate decarboxylase [Salisediminibacterium halotolerans]GEL08116.1 flavin prenyltransferase UbiX [Salisediminibacterium halotolerans]